MIFVIHALLVGGCAVGALALSRYALVVYIALCCVWANIFVLKQITLFGFTATCADAFAIGAIIGLSLLQEYVGRSVARIAMIINFAVLALYALLCTIHLWYTPSIYDTTQIHYSALMGIMPRITIASFTAFSISQILDYHLFGFLKSVVSDNRWLLLRTCISTGISQFIDTVLFTLLGLYGVVAHPWHIIFVSFFIKIMVMLIAAPIASLSRLMPREYLDKP